MDVSRRLTRNDQQLRVLEGEILTPQPHCTYIVIQGYLCVEVDVTMPTGIKTFTLGNIEEGEFLFEGELLPVPVQGKYELRYCAVIDVVLKKVTTESLPTTAELWRPFFLSFVRAMTRQRTRLHELATLLFRSKYELQQSARSVSPQVTVLERECARLRNELQSVQARVLQEGNAHAEEVRALRAALKEINDQSTVNNRPTERPPPPNEPFRVPGQRDSSGTATRPTGLTRPRSIPSLAQSGKSGSYFPPKQ